MPYAIGVIRYRRPLEEVLSHVEAHRAYLRGLKEQGILLVSGPFSPRNGGALLLRLPEGDLEAQLDRIRDNDPYVKTGMAQYEMLVWEPGIGREALDNL
ncbi:MAG: YCII-like protein [Acidobacteriaceae bacterium]|nr:YCII-like protein [Acidobacteriaceae bacterium]